MTYDEINKAIAEACGIVGKDQWGPLYRTKDGVVRNCPDYCKDLNAMHEAEKLLTEIQCAFYRQNLQEIITDIPASMYVWHATARQRAEAFLRTINPHTV